MSPMRALGSRIIYPPASAASSTVWDKDSLLTDSAYRPRPPPRWPLARLYDHVQYLLEIRFRLSTTVTTRLVFVLLAPVLAVVLIFLTVFSSSGNSLLLLPAKEQPRYLHIGSDLDKPFVLGCLEPAVDEPRENAVLVILARNSEIDGVTDSIRSLERHFNRWFHYPYVFLNDEPFNSTFRARMRAISDSDMDFGVIDPKDWNFPDWADEDDIIEGVARQGDAGIKYGGMMSYHKMCRFYSGKFYNHPLLLQYDWYWRVEPDVKYFCDITYDPFVYMARHNKIYGFTIFIKELVETVPNFFRQTAGFKRSRNMTDTSLWDVFLAHEHEPDWAANPDVAYDSVAFAKQRWEEKQRQDQEQRHHQGQRHHQKDTSQNDPPSRFRSSKKSSEWENFEQQRGRIHPYAMNGEVYNMCHFWSNFEIARLDFFRSPEYNDYFDYLERSGGFWNERWGDAPVHSLAAGLFLETEQLHYFRDIGYRHTTIQHCPANAPSRQRPHVPYIQDRTDKEQLEQDEYWAHPDPVVENGVGCRCRCDTDAPEVEFKDGSCMAYWAHHVSGRRV